MTELPPTQDPAWQVSVLVQALPSLHGVPSAAAGLEQAPVPVLHAPAAWHWSAATHVTGFDPMQAPATHESVCVQAFPSLQAVPSVFAGFEQVPFAGSQVPMEWHWSLAIQVTGLAPVHVPA